VPAIEPPALRDDDLTLRPPRPDDADAVIAACQDAAIVRWVRVPSPYRREHAESWLATCRRQAEAGEAITLLAEDGDGRLAGSFSLLELAGGGGYGEIGYWVAPWARGRGVATRAVGLLRDWAAAALGLTTVEILVHRDNAPSRAVALRSGFADTGELRTLPRDDDPGPPALIVYLWEACRSSSPTAW
jgi:RimJ/RimL family protein N-acetyltransferase